MCNKDYVLVDFCGNEAYCKATKLIAMNATKAMVLECRSQTYCVININIANINVFKLMIYL